MTELDESWTVDVAGGCYSPSRSPLDEAVPHSADVLTQQHGTNLDDDEWVVGDLSRLAQ